MPFFDLNGKVALVTGAARGIGFETARQMHLRGASVAVLDLDAGQASEAAERIGPRAIGVAADVTDEGAMKASVAEVVEKLGGLDVAVANAGIAQTNFATARGISGEEWERVFEVDMLGVWRTARAALPQIVERRGQMVVISSVYAFFNGFGNSPYAVAKAGVESLGRALRVELAPHGASATVAYFGWPAPAWSAASRNAPRASSSRSGGATSPPCAASSTRCLIAAWSGTPRPRR